MLYKFWLLRNENVQKIIVFSRRKSSFYRFNPYTIFSPPKNNAMHMKKNPLLRQISEMSNNKCSIRRETLEDIKQIIEVKIWANPKMIFCRGSLSLFVHPKHQNYMATSDHKESAGPVDTIISVEHKGKPHHCVHSTPNHKIPVVEITLELLGEW